MILAIAGFEFRYQVKGPVFWLTAALFFVLSFLTLALDQLHVGGDNGAIHRNAPFALAQIHLVFALFFMFASTAMVASGMVRDEETGFGPILRSTRLGARDFAIGRFLGAFGAVLLAYLAVPAGLILGSLSPWLDAETLGPFRPLDYLADYLCLAVPILFLTSALFFALASAVRSMMGAYLGMVALLVGWMVASAVTDRPELERTVAIVEPFGFGAYGYLSKYWTALERNSRALPADPLLVLHHLLWLGVGLAVLVVAISLYRFEERPRALARRKRPDRDEALSPSAPAHAPLAPGDDAAVIRDADWAAPILARARFDAAQIFKSPAFIILMALALFNAGGGLWFATGPYEVDVYPVTRRVIDILRGAFTFIPVIVAIFYAGELVWRERERRMDEIIDATPAPDFAFALPKILAIALVLVAMLFGGAALGVVFQLARGWSQLEIEHYLLWYVAPSSVTVILMAVLAVFVQCLAPHKFVGFGLMLVFVMATPVLSSLGLEDHLYRYASTPPVPLSDLNGEGRYALIRGVYQAYWSAVALVLVLLCHLLWRRGRQDALPYRLQRLPRRLRGRAGLALTAGLVLAIGLGGFIFYNSHILNPYRTRRGVEDWQADFERTLLPFETLAQPKISDVRLMVDLYPHQNRAMTRGLYRFVNRTDQPIRDLHLHFARDVRVISLSVEGARPKTTYERFNYRIFAFDTPLAPGESRSLSFETERSQKGFRNEDNDWTGIEDNGTFLNAADLAPAIGMDRDGLLKDRAVRRKHGLPAQLRMAPLGDEKSRAFNFFGKDADFVNADITVSTVADQTPMAPGYKVAERIEQGRRIAEFRTEAPILKFFSIQSAAYARKSETWKGVALSLYHHPAHDWNLDRILTALKVGLDYDQAAFSPYQFRQVRVLEFPALQGVFAQSFANTIPWSEDLGWIIDARDPAKIDMTSYVTAHELAHQWFAHQVIGANQQGATMLDETLAQYAALMAMERLHGKAQIRRFLKFELDRYLRARGGELVEEVPLERVENQGYIHYNKGALVMYRLKEVLGEDRVNAALAEFLRRHAFKGAPYPTSAELVSLFREKARPDQQTLITDLFEKITLYDLRAEGAVVRRMKDGRYSVELTVLAKKLHADGQGRETEAPLDEPIDIGLFLKDPQAADFGAADVLALHPYRIVSGRQKIVLVTDHKPVFAGIDPYASLIDRKTDDNLIRVR